MKTEIFIIHTPSVKSLQSRTVLNDFKKVVKDRPFTNRLVMLSFFKGMFYYAMPQYKFKTVEEFHDMTLTGNLNLGEYEYILIEYPDK